MSREARRARGYHALSFWMDSLDSGVTPRASLGGDLTVDVAIVGAGYTGLWTAYYLSLLAPFMKIALLEREVAGYGASGRNGGWCSALFAASHARLARESGLEAMHAMRLAMNDTVDEVGRVALAEGIDCHFRKRGTLVAARSKAQVQTLLGELAEARELGIGEEDLRWHEGGEASRLIGASEVRGALYTPHCAAIHPARLARGLATCLEKKGVEIYEQTEALDVISGNRARPIVVTPFGRVSADAVVIATEGYTCELAGHRRDVVPVYSLMIATEPLGANQLSSLGSAVADGTTFSDGRHLIIYGQVTADGRLAFGGRGAPYHFGSRTSPRYDTDASVHASLAATIAELFPALGEVHVTHRWGGPIGVHRDWFPSVAYDSHSGIASAGGYVGDGVGTTNLAGRTLADLILGRSSELTSLPWVGHKSRPWEPEPLRWLGVNAGLALMQVADAQEARSGRPSRLAGAFSRFLGG